ncbi:hypothetical protein GSI_00416 [Ganoderma sinense ZZ0214-1]|uniref:DUF6534 domain-containing protein n=1 Tax=Ganoderma sinense ZZ0214-1 TaxID=1077348 RepID=A0A2G8SSI0_9APHY|nr:hypothetical protein GSI_00416 [Ganoderma sinense ZZ0214-1]
MGILLISVVLSGARTNATSTSLWGVSCSQVLYYYIRFPNDPLSIKLLVGAVTASDTIHQALITHSIYWYLVTEYGNPRSLALLVKSIVVEVIFQCITGFLVQGYYTICVWRLSKGKLYLVIPVAAMVLTEFGLSLAYSIIALTRLETFSDLVQIKMLSACTNIFAAIPDVAIASILCTILYRSRTGSPKSNILINRLMVFAINTGLLTSVCACISLITFFAFPTTFIYICFYFLIGRLYANSLMAMLNARRSRRDGCNSDDTTVSLREVPTAGSNLTHCNVNAPSSPGGGRIAIRVNTTKEMKHEPMECNTAGTFGPDTV